MRTATLSHCVENINIGFYPISSFTEENKELLELRCELQFAEEDEVCYHHEKAYLSSYQRLQKKCADPYIQTAP